MSAILLENDLLHYEVLGRGRPVFFLHDWLGSWRYWLPMMQSISSGYRTYALDFWGFGESVRNGRYSIVEQTKLVSDFCEKLGIIRVAIVGHGLGALVALSVANQWPELVDRIVAIALPFSINDIDKDLIQNPEAINNEVSHQSMEWQEIILSELKKIDNQALPVSLENQEDLETAMLQRNSASTPCLYVYGQNDGLLNAPASDVLQAIPENHHAIFFDQSGHFPFLDESSTFGRLLNQFLALERGESIQNIQLKKEWQRRIR